ncbi:hypothetical protein J6590_105646, partial [Homalodisca vitripennis]
MINSKRIYDMKLRNLQLSSTANFIQQADNKSKALWQVINKERKGKCEEKLLTELEINNTLSKSTKEMAEYFNTYFSKIAENTLDQNREIAIDPGKT